MRTEHNLPPAVLWQLDAEHEAFRGLAARSAMRLVAVLTAIVLVIGLALNLSDAADASRAAAAIRLANSQQSEAAEVAFP
jgi:hypothetical protein